MPLIESAARVGGFFGERDARMSCLTCSARETGPSSCATGLSGSTEGEACDSDGAFVAERAESVIGGGGDASVMSQIRIEVSYEADARICGCVLEKASDKIGYQHHNSASAACRGDGGLRHRVRRAIRSLFLHEVQ